MSKDEQDRASHEVECKAPVTLSADDSGGDTLPMSDNLEFPKTGDVIFRHHDVEAGENFVKVDNPSGEYVVPLPVGDRLTLSQNDVDLDFFKSLSDERNALLSSAQGQSKCCSAGLALPSPRHGGEDT